MHPSQPIAARADERDHTSLSFPQYAALPLPFVHPKTPLRNQVHIIQSYLFSSSDNPNLMSSLSPFVETSFDTSPPPNESLSIRPQPDPHQRHMCANVIYLLQLLLLRYANNPAAHASLLRSAFAFKGPTGNAPFVEPEGLAQDIIDRLHMVWEIAGRSPQEYADSGDGAEAA